MAESSSESASESVQATLSPLMQQYTELKGQAEGAMLLFRMGDFYELFGEDAVEASKLLEITLTSRDKGKPDPLPMAGVPAHSVQGYLARLLKAGKKVAIGEQIGTPGQGANAQKIVKREITRVYTPAIHFDAETSEAQYLATATRSQTGQTVLACLDISTGELRISGELSETDFLLQLRALPIRHWIEISGSGVTSPELRIEFDARNVLREELPAPGLGQAKAEQALRDCYEVADLSAFFESSSASHAAGILVHYALKSQRLARLPHLKSPTPLVQAQSLRLGPNAYEHLDLEELFALIHRCKSAMGSRRLRAWLKSPLTDLAQIGHRQNALKYLASRPALQVRLSAQLAQIYDLERLLGRLHAGLAHPRDTLAMGQSLQALTGIHELLGLEKQLPDKLFQLAGSLAQTISILGPWATRLKAMLREDAPLSTKEGGIFSRGTSAELDRLMDLTEEGERWLVELEARERAATGIASLKVRYNRVFGYYLEVTSAHLASVPAHYQRKQTMVGAERFFTEELKRFEEDILTAGTKRKSLEAQLFEELLTELRSATPEFKAAAEVLAELDVLQGLSLLCQGWTFPSIDESGDLEIVQGRHPLVDASSRGSFVPNTVRLPSSHPLLMITGPNMGGKSTVMRQTALIVLLGRMGTPVPAQTARWGVVSGIYTRIGAHDAISRGQSTFMVEMTELAHILHHADSKALIILDEIGRGTSTYDGMSVAWATLEWMTQNTRARTLFATHYHELTDLSQRLTGLANAHMAVESGRNQKLRFLYRLDPGPASESFGIHVAALAGLPKPVVQRAWEVFAELESHAPATQDREESQAQLSFFGNSTDFQQATPQHDPLREQLRETDPDQMTPLQALQFVVSLKKIAHAPEAASS